MAASEIESEGKKPEVLIGSLTSGIVMVLLVLCLFLYIQKRKKESKIRKDDNKLGEGGFGPVYKGALEDGQEIAVKRLSSTSTQGIDEFKNEAHALLHVDIKYIYDVQASNMPTLTSQKILADRKRNVLLDWPKRFHIINGIARGLLYLHQDSRLRIIHRDLKASNVLLDSDMNPKISDFGTARSFGGNETSAKTRRVVGTYGYMSPEYAVDGLFSAWTLYKEERSLELVDASLGKSFCLPEVLRSIHVGLLCVQKKPDDRPSMSSVVLMLGNEGVLPPANQPGFFLEREVTAQSSTTTTTSTNELTITMPEGR
ncbi:UNVERIFIED_CONTAM: G-type lectin S-receptor-like serine/threonine-protein kinase SD1-1 [Sesamum radiatum]|uniref:G-type lectin S-receptor-like serine/threonine-protein kinase SD1-1 n=1 Tax=Sesamum radiatum TaxID=300843 RepID=A0AAW2KHJ4_SESRA